MIAHFTTLIPHDLKGQLHNLLTWRNAYDLPIYTVNHSRELKIISANLPEWVRPVEVRFARRFGRDYIPLSVLYDAIHKTIGDSKKRIVFTNSDIRLADPHAIQELEPVNCDLLYASRNDVDAKGETQGIYRKGYDVFSIGHEKLKILDVPDVFLGMPWWDYTIPLTALFNGYSLRRLDTNAFTHAVHKQRWSEVGFNFIGEKIMQRFLTADSLPNTITSKQVLCFAKKVNSLLNNDIFLNASPISNANIDDLKSELSVFNSKDCVPTYTFIEFHRHLLTLYQETKTKATQEEIIRRMHEISLSIPSPKAKNYQMTFERYAELISIQLQDPSISERICQTR
nr:hypothetical protein [uncultured Cohaesibacter sp.]